MSAWTRKLREFIISPPEKRGWIERYSRYAWMQKCTPPGRMLLWIFLAAPWLEQIAARPRLGAAMKGISAAVVGVILNLSVWFALHVLFGTVTPFTDGMVRLPVPALDTLDLSALALTVTAAGLMGWRKLGMIPALATLALCGMAQHLL